MAGKLLDRVLEEAYSDAGISIPDYCIINTIACTPFESKARNEIGKPTKEYIENCRPQVAKLFKLVNPKLVVLLGEYAQKAYLDHFPNVEYCSLRHPSFIRRQGGESSVEFKRNYLILSKALQQLGSSDVSQSTTEERSKGKKRRKWQDVQFE